MECIIVIYFSLRKEIIITYGSDKWTHLLIKSTNSFSWSNEKMIVNLGIKKGKNNNNPSPQLTCLQNSLLMSTVNTPEKYLSNVEGKCDMRKVRTSLVKSLSTLFLC